MSEGEFLDRPVAAGPQVVHVFLLLVRLFHTVLMFVEEVFELLGQSAVGCLLPVQMHPGDVRRAGGGVVSTALDLPQRFGELFLIDSAQIRHQLLTLVMAGNVTH